jgi:hypothetical protein
VIPVISLDRRSIADGLPGPLTGKFIRAFRELANSTGTPVAAASVTTSAATNVAGNTVTLGGTATGVDAAGTASVGDTDGDGVPELIVGSEGLARVFHGLAGGLSPAVTSWTWRPVTDAVWYGDLDGDGLPDAFMIGEDHFPDSEEGDSWVGTLVYARAAAE